MGQVAGGEHQVGRPMLVPSLFQDLFEGPLGVDTEQGPIGITIQVRIRDLEDPQALGGRAGRPSGPVTDRAPMGGHRIAVRR